MTAVLLIAGLCVAVAVAACLARWSLGPLGDAVRRVNAPTRFALADLIWLAILVQIALGASTAMYRGDFEKSSRWTIMSFLLAAAVGIWVGGVSTMARAGISDPKRRGVFVLVVLPLVIMGMIVAIGATMFVPGFLLSIVLLPSGSAAVPTLVAGGVFAATAAALVAARYISGWIVRPARSDVLNVTVERPDEHGPAS